MEEHIKKKVDKTLTSLDNIGRLEANPYLYAKVKEKIETQEYPAFKLTWGLVSLCLFTACNIFTYFSMSSGVQEGDTDTLTQLASEYGMDWTYLDFNELVE